MQKSNIKPPLIGGIAAAMGASLCCVGPLVLLSLGIGGAWIGNLTLLEPYRPIFIAIVLILFSWSGWQLYRPAAACEAGMACATPQVRRRRRIIFWIAATIALALITSAYWIPLVVPT